MREKNRPGTAAGAAAPGVPGRGQGGLKSALELLRKRKFALAACFLAALLALCGLRYAGSLHTARTVLSLDYEEASQGLTPSRTRFNIFEIRGGEVMEKLIERAGLKGKTTPEKLSECVSVKATHGKNVSGSVNYISTSFVVSFTDDGAAGDKGAEEMLALLCDAYREYFVEHYGYNHSILSFDVDGLKFNDEYLTAVDLLEMKCSQLEKYAQLRARESKNYRDPETGLTFSALERRANDLAEYDIAKVRSYVIENGVASDRAGLKSILGHKIRMDRLVYDKMMAAYEEDNTGIRMYDAAMSAVVMIPTQDRSMQYYMSRTKTGMDNMAVHADAQLAGAAERMEKIAYNTYLTEKMGANVPGRAKTEKADAMIRETAAALDALSADIRAVDSAYTSAKARNYISFSEADMGAAERIGLATSLLGAAAFALAAFACAFLWKCLSDKRKKV